MQESNETNPLENNRLTTEAPHLEAADKPSQASTMVTYATERMHLFHDLNADIFAKDRTTHETQRINTHQFHDWLVAGYYAVRHQSPRDQAVREALSTLKSLGRFDDESQEVHIRVAQQNSDNQDTYYLDLGEPGQSRAVKIQAGAWSIIDTPPVLFERPKTLRPLPEPVRGGSIEALWKIANIPENSRLLVLAWLCECLRPETPFPLLELFGEQGSAKSTTQNALRILIDPNTCNLRSTPKNVEDIFVSARANWLVSYENISHLSPPMQDAFCILATGGGYAKRKLYSNFDESVMTAKRPIILNGINTSVTAQDLIDRALSVETPLIGDRIEITTLLPALHDEHGNLLGALLTIMADALHYLPEICLEAENRPRLAEFARLGIAVARATGKEGADFMEQFNFSRQESIARTIDASPLASALIEWFETRNKQAIQLTLKNLLHEVTPFKPKNSDTWPQSAKGLGDALRRIAPALRQMGIECKSTGKTGGKIEWEIRAKENAPPVPQTLPKSSKQDMQDIQDMPQEFSFAGLADSFWTPAPA